MLILSAIMLDMEPLLQIKGLEKRFGDYLANNQLTFNVPRGSLFGLLGPNGAGKTTLIRTITNIIEADSGEILFDGAPLNVSHKHRIGYMPEERGLYKKMKAEEHLLYLARLKGLSKSEALEKIRFWFDRFDIQDWQNKRVDELSKGMQQKLQFISTVLHEPDLLILDEPFSGLDPINANLIKDEIHTLQAKGITIIFSTHRMEQVEELCEELVLMNKGEVVLAGEIDQLKSQFKLNVFELVIEGDYHTPIEGLSVEVAAKNRLMVKGEGMDSSTILNAFISVGYSIVSFREVLPSINEIFIQQVSQQHA